MEGDITAGEDPVVRAAAVEALGNMNGTIVAMDPDSGRILAMVNQKLALSAGAQPCSTIKVAVALAALSENVITKDTQVPLGKYWKVDLTTALAKSNNAYFEAVGRKLGFEKVSYYAHQFGLGELAGWNIPSEHLGTFPSTELDEKLGGVGKMCSFGESISLTPLQLAALMGAIANGGTLYYLQHPTTPEEVANFTPKAKRKLDIGPLIPEISEGMSGAVEYGTARLLRTNFIEEPILGQDRDLLQGWHSLWLVWLVRQHPVRPYRDGRLPGRRAANLWAQGCRACWNHVSQSLRSRLLRGEGACYCGPGNGSTASRRSAVKLHIISRTVTPIAPAIA